MALSSSPVLFIVVAAAVAAATVEPTDEMEQMWRRFQGDFNRSYGDVDEPRRFLAFKRSVAMARMLNTEQSINCDDLFDDDSCVFGITKFSDLFEDEFEATYLGYKPQATPEDTTNRILTEEELADGAGVDSVDWRKKGAVTPVKDQGNCGSCWAFSTTEEVESAVFMATGKLEVLSTQQIISCDKGGGDDGCDGGDTVSAYHYLEKAGGLDLASDYPDKSHNSGRTGKCTWDKKVAAKVSGFAYATPPCKKGACKKQNEGTLAAAVASNGPVSICVNAGGNGWQNYKKGIFSKRCSGAETKLDHCVQIVGFDKSGSTPYWIVRNSWNTDWGEKGYMRLEMGKNLCGVADEATIVTATTAMSSPIVAV